MRYEKIYILIIPLYGWHFFNLALFQSGAFSIWHFFLKFGRIMAIEN
jgi:hypothetical protein